MRASIPSPFNIFIPQLAIYITGILKHSSPIPKSKPQHKMQHQVMHGEILMVVEHKVASMNYE